MYREERRQEIAQQENISIEHCTEVGESMLDTSNFEEDLLHDNQEYLEKIELRKKIASVIDKRVVREKSLTRTSHV